MANSITVEYNGKKVDLVRGNDGYMCPHRDCTRRLGTGMTMQAHIKKAHPQSSTNAEGGGEASQESESKLPDAEEVELDRTIVRSPPSRKPERDRYQI